MYNVFLADDEIWVIIGLKKLIEKTGAPFRISGEANNGIMALEEIKEKRPDVVITDIRMPGLDGLGLMEQLQDVLPDTKVVLISGYAEFAYAQKALQMGAVDYLLKPVEFEKLKGVLKRLEQLFDKEEREQTEDLKEDMNPSMAQMIVKEIQENYASNITLTILAERYNISASHLSVLLKEHLGLPFSEYIALKRVQKAKELLADGSLSVQMIAEMVGYKDYFYFTKVFKKMVGLTPSKFRKNLYRKNY